MRRGLVGAIARHACAAVASSASVRSIGMTRIVAPPGARVHAVPAGARDWISYQAALMPQLQPLGQQERILVHNHKLTC